MGRTEVCRARCGGAATTAEEASVFLFFSNRLGCLGSILVSVVLTVILIAVLRAL